MSYARWMLSSYSQTVPVDSDVLVAAIEALTDCTQACKADIDADLGEPNVADMVKMHPVVLAVC